MIRFEHDGSGRVEAVADVDVGARRRSIRVPLGPWTRSEADAEGLRCIPVVIAIDSGASDVIMAGVDRAGPPAVIATSVSSEEPVGGRLLAAARRGTEVLLVAGATDGSLLDQV